MLALIVHCSPLVLFELDSKVVEVITNGRREKIVESIEYEFRSTYLNTDELSADHCSVGSKRTSSTVQISSFYMREFFVQISELIRKIIAQHGNYSPPPHCLFFLSRRQIFKVQLQIITNMEEKAVSRMNIVGQLIRC